MTGFYKNNLDFEILDANNVKHILFLDASEYFEEPEKPLLKITLPGQSKYLLVNIEPNKINVLTSNTIGLNDILESRENSTLPDGIYTFYYAICPYDKINITKYRLRTTSLDQQINLIYANIDIIRCLEDNNSIKKDLLDIHILIESAKANAIYGNLDKAQKEYSIASKKVSKLFDKICNL